MMHPATATQPTQKIQTHTHTHTHTHTEQTGGETDETDTRHEYLFKATTDRGR